MGRVTTNSTTINVTREASLGVLASTPAWYELEPNTINQFGTTIAKTERSPISRARARRKGVVTDLDSAVELEADVTLEMLRYFVEGFLFTRAVSGDVFFPTASTSAGFTVPALSAPQAGKLIYSAGGAKSLIYSRGFVNDGNNGLELLSAAVAPGATNIPVAGNLAETPGVNVLASASTAGLRAAPGDLKIDAQGNITSVALDFTTTGLVAGQVIHVGGVSITNQFFNPANIGFARIIAVAPTKLTLAKRDQPFVVDDGTSTGTAGTPVAVDLLFGSFARNVRVGDADYLETPYQFENVSPNLMAGGLPGYEYAIGNWADALSMTIPLSGKATMSLGFVGLDTTKPSSVRAANAANAKAGGRTAAFGTASDIARLRVQDVDETGLTTDFKSVTFTLTNNVAGEKVLAKLGPKYLNAGNIEVDVETQVIFSNPDVIERIRCNRTVGLDWVLRNGDGGAAFDLPTGTLGGGGREYPANQSVLLNTTFMAHQDDPVQGFTCGVSFFPVLPPVPCA
jgi:hypothetical protein